MGADSTYRLKYLIPNHEFPAAAELFVHGSLSQNICHQLILFSIQPMLHLQRETQPLQATAKRMALNLLAFHMHMHLLST